MLANQHVRFGERVTGDPLQGATAPYSTPGEHTHAWMRSLSYSSSITMLTESEPCSISQRIAYRGVAEEAVGLQPWPSVTNELNASIPIEPNSRDESIISASSSLAFSIIEVPTHRKNPRDTQRG